MTRVFMITNLAILSLLYFILIHYPFMIRPVNDHVGVWYSDSFIHILAICAHKLTKKWRYKSTQD